MRELSILVQLAKFHLHILYVTQEISSDDVILLLHLDIILILIILWVSSVLTFFWIVPRILGVIQLD